MELQATCQIGSAQFRGNGFMCKALAMFEEQEVFLDSTSADYRTSVKSFESLLLLASTIHGIAMLG